MSKTGEPTAAGVIDDDGGRGDVDAMHDVMCVSHARRRLQCAA